MPASVGWVWLVVVLPFLGFLVNGALSFVRPDAKRAVSTVGVGVLVLSFLMAVVVASAVFAEPPHGHPYVVQLWTWMAAGSLQVDLAFQVDQLSIIMMLVVTGISALIHVFSIGYMREDPGYPRYFAYLNLFVFFMLILVLGASFPVMFIGWEGVGLCSYLLIGFWYQNRPFADAGKKAFIMNRIGDLGLSMGLMLTYVKFGTVEYDKLFPMIQPYMELAQQHRLSEIPFLIQLIPVLFTVGAFGKSAQLPLYVWLPDAMEGPTPVSALIHAATMVTAGVYLVARFFPLYLCSEWALPLVAWVGGLTALLAATIGMAQFDIKRIMAYSTVSQLGYMFAGIGVLGAVGGAAHVFTHAFFKALLFLACGAVMHGFAGQLDLRKLSGLWHVKGWKIVSITMLVGCINLAGLPFITAGFWSKDMIIGDAFANGKLAIVGWILLITAGLTAYYTFRVFIRVFVGPVQFEPGDEVHGHSDDHGHEHGHGEQAHDAHAPHGSGGPGAHEHFHPHAPGWAINLVLSILAIASFGAIFLVSEKVGGEHLWIKGMVGDSTAGAMPPHAEHATLFGMSAHEGAMYGSIVVGLVGILAAFYLHYLGRKTAAVSKADSIRLGWIQTAAQHKWYVDEIYDWTIVKPLWVLAHIFHTLDRVLVDGLVNVFGWAPRGTGQVVRRTQSGVLHDYALRMAGGVALVVLAIWFLRGPGLLPGSGGVGSPPAEEGDADGGHAAAVLTPAAAPLASQGVMP
jgi:NADH-quinone oxidoreductase subunit L